MNNGRFMARDALGIAEKAGADAARITLNKGTINSVCISNGKIDKLQMCNDCSLYIQLYANGRYGAFSTNILERNQLDKFIRDAVDAVRLITPDVHRSLPDPSLYYIGNKEEDLGQYDPCITELPQDERKRIAFDLYEQMAGKSGHLVHAESEYSDYTDYEYMADTQGFEGTTLQSSFEVTAECSVKGKGDARYESWWHDSSLKFNRLKYSDCGKEALDRALRKMNPRKIASGKYGMVVENIAASRMVAPLFSALSGSAIEQKRSFLLDSLDKRILGENVSITDSPHLYGKSGSRYYDSEGIATKEMPIIENGIIKTYYINCYNASKLKCPPTVDAPSVPVFSDNTAEKCGNIAEIIRKMGNGIFITGFNGGNCNGTTGDFSYGIEGFLFEKGEIKYPVREMNITGNMLSLWNNLFCFGADPLEWTRWQTPTLAFNNVDFNGL